MQEAPGIHVLQVVLPPWLTEEDVDYFTGEFVRTGFRGELNWYRNIDNLWADIPFLTGAKITQPALFIMGSRDAAAGMYQKTIDTMERSVPNLRKKAVIPEAGHWIQQERAAEVNELIIDFLYGL